MNMQDAKPLKNYVMCRVPKVEDRKVGGIILALAANQERPEHAEVIAVGPEVDDIKPGMVVCYDKRADKQYGDVLFLNNRDVWAAFDAQ